MAQRHLLLPCVFVLSFALPVVGEVESKGPSMTREDIFKAVQSLSREKDLFSASEFILGLKNEAEIVGAYSNLVLDCYQKAKSTEQVLHFANAGIHYCLARASTYDGKDDDAAKKLRFAAKRMATNAASSTWTGWEEPGVTISPDQMRQGLAMARYSVRQLHELDPSAAQLAFTYWFLGVQLIAQESYGEALSVLVHARDYSKAHGTSPDELAMLEGYIGLTRILNGEKDVGESEFGSSVSALESRENQDAKFYAKQLLSVRAFFAKQ